MSALANPPCREADRIELGLRAAMAIKAENAGIYIQRTAFLRSDQEWMPPRAVGGWKIHYKDGHASKMTWHWAGWSPDA